MVDHVRVRKDVDNCGAGQQLGESFNVAQNGRRCFCYR